MATRILARIAALLLLPFAAAQAQSTDTFRALVLNGYEMHWGQEHTRGSEIVLTYALVAAPTTFADAINCGRMKPIDELLGHSKLTRDALDTEVQAAFLMWSSVARVSFAPAKVWQSADILIGAQIDPEGHAYTNVFPAADSPGTIQHSTICLNPERRWKIGFDGNLTVFDLRYTLAHEIGHALGFDHPSRSGELMSWRYDEQFRTLQSGDLEGAATQYGLRATATNPAVALHSRTAPIVLVPSSLGLQRR